LRKNIPGEAGAADIRVKNCDAREDGAAKGGGPRRRAGSADAERKIRPHGGAGIY